MTRWRIAFPISAVGVLCLAMNLRDGPATQGADEKPDPDYGTITGQFVVDGAVPQPRLLVKKGDPKTPDPAICAATDLFSDELVVDAKSGGIANIFVYLPKAAKIHPALKASKVKEVVVDQQGCRFVPHALFARTDQTIVIKSNDNCNHNTNFSSTRNESFNFVVAANDRQGGKAQLKVPESLPVPVQCNIHPWMKSQWLILDHPYAAISDAEGRFKIADLPAGAHEFRIWHEGNGYVDRMYKVTVKGGQTVDLGKIKVPAAQLIEKK